MTPRKKLKKTRLYKVPKKKGKSSCRKRKFVASVGLALVLIFGSPRFASAKSSSQNQNNLLAHERVISNGLRGGLITLNTSMETMSRQLSKEYRESQKDLNSPPLSKRFDTNKCSKERFMELAKDTKAKEMVFHKTTVDEELLSMLKAKEL